MTLVPLHDLVARRNTANVNITGQFFLGGVAKDAKEIQGKLMFYFLPVVQAPFSPANPATGEKWVSIKGTDAVRLTVDNPGGAAYADEGTRVTFEIKADPAAAGMLAVTLPGVNQNPLVVNDPDAKQKVTSLVAAVFPYRPGPCAETNNIIPIDWHTPWRGEMVDKEDHYVYTNKPVALAKEAVAVCSTNVPDLGANWSMLAVGTWTAATVVNTHKNVVLFDKGFGKLIMIIASDCTSTPDNHSLEWSGTIRTAK
jgi:hypothetical protein